MRVTVGVSGGIAAYKAAELVRDLQKQALDVHVVMTAAAQRFVQPLTFAALSGHRVITGLWAAEGAGEPGEAASAIEHIDAAQTTDALVVAPATADILAKFAHGIADDFLTTLYLATAAPVIVAPAMNVNMWQHPATKANLETLANRNVRVVAPGSGYLACGMVGAGRMAENEAIVAAVLSVLHHRNDLAGETVLVTAGGTLEREDGVRAGRCGRAARRAGDSGDGADGAHRPGGRGGGSGGDHRGDAARGAEPAGSGDDRHQSRGGG
jgi:phosphopantothenoylcysteine decarboxylase / phosphopantothenate---cysteine ligase